MYCHALYECSTCPVGWDSHVVQPTYELDMYENDVWMLIVDLLINNRTVEQIKATLRQCDCAYWCLCGCV